MRSTIFDSLNVRRILSLFRIYSWTFLYFLQFLKQVLLSLCQSEQKPQYSSIYVWLLNRILPLLYQFFADPLYWQQVQQQNTFKHFPLEAFSTISNNLSMIGHLRHRKLWQRSHIPSRNWESNCGISTDLLCPITSVCAADPCERLFFLPIIETMWAGLTPRYLIHLGELAMQNLLY